jgi:hypothetical protein
MDTSEIQFRLAAVETTDLLQRATALTGWLIDDVEFASAANISGVRSRFHTFSERLDSRTIFATDSRFGYLGELGAWTGSGRVVTARCRAILRTAGIPKAEIAGIEILTDHGQSARRTDDDTFELGPQMVLGKVGRALRAVEGIPVWSSHAFVQLTDKAEVGSVEIHWPELPASAIKEVKRLCALVEKGFAAPYVPGARPESVAVGIIHSPAIGFMMDIAPSIRVVYVADDADLGRKVVVHLDRHGEHIEMPRDIRPSEPPEQKRANASSTIAG